MKSMCSPIVKLAKYERMVIILNKAIKIDNLIPNDMILDDKNCFVMNETTFNIIHKENNFEEAVDIVSPIDLEKAINLFKELSGLSNNKKESD